jgi:hypothetical protein
MSSIAGKHSYFGHAAIVAFSITIASPAATEMSPSVSLAKQPTLDQPVDGRLYLVARHVSRHFARRAPPTEEISQEQEPGGATGEALAACEKGNAKSDSLSLP